MIIQPKLSSPSSLDHVEMIRTDSKKYIYVIFQDDAGNPVDIVEEYDNTNASRGELDLQVTTIDGDILYSESYFPPSVSPELLRVSHPSVGKYQIQWGINTNETDLTGTILFNWHLRKDLGEEDFYRTQVVEVTPPKVLALLPYLRLQIDKSLKVINQEQYCNLGYSDSNLVAFLNLGLSYINGRQPYVGWSTLDQFPLDRGLNILLKCAVYDGLFAQLIFAIDTDVPTFSDQGHAFVITHATQIKSVRDSLSQELEKQVREFKLHYISWGVVGVEMRLGWSWYMLLATSPSGSLFRNSFSSVGTF